MQIFLWIVFLVVIGIAIFAVQNSTAPPIMMKFLFWSFETSLIYTILMSIGLGMLIILFLWIPRGIRSSFREKNLRRELEILGKQGKPQVLESKSKGEQIG